MEFFGEWAKAFQKRRWWLWIILLLIFKLAENWSLNKLQSLIESKSGWLYSMLTNHPEIIVWIPVVITVIVLLALTWHDARKISLKTSVGLNAKLDEPIKTEGTKGKYTIEFYRTRDELDQGRKRLPTELRGTQKVWVAWWTGISPKSQGVLNIGRHPPIDRIILIDPHGGFFPYLCKIDDIRDKQIKSTSDFIVNFGNECKGLGCTVRFFDGPIEGMIVADYETYKDEDEFSDRAWIRVEPSIPYVDRDNPCNYVVYNTKHNGDERDITLFRALIEHYNFIWERSADEPTPEDKIVALPITDKTKAKLDELIKRGEKLARIMKGANFEWLKLQPQVQEWEDKVSHDIWEIAPQYAATIVDEKEHFTDNEKREHIGWNSPNSSLHVSVSRKLRKLREIRSKL
jgi:hypothetical protein